MDSTILTSGMVNMFTDYHKRKKLLKEKHEREHEEQERQFWLDPAVAHNVPRSLFNICRERYFGRMNERHREELEALDKEYISGQFDVAANDKCLI